MQPVAELQSSMPVLPLTVGCRVQFEAIDPTSGATVANVTVSRAVIYATDRGLDLSLLDDPVPLYTPEELAGMVG
jgi:hypothetical protein